MPTDSLLRLIGFIPIFTTLLSALLGTLILRRFRQRPFALHLLWWGAGIYIYGLGTLTESLTSLFGWNEFVFRLWYLSGALLGGAPLAQGSVYYHLPRRAAHILAACLVTYVLVAAFFIWTVPVNAHLAEPHRLTGKVFALQWVRWFSPFINLYALIFLVGGAIRSALYYWKTHLDFSRFIGNVLLAVGALLPGIGGAFTRFGYTEVLYVFEFIGILLIWRGYRLCTPGDSHF